MGVAVSDGKFVVSDKIAESVAKFIDWNDSGGVSFPELVLALHTPDPSVPPAEELWARDALGCKCGRETS